MRVCGLNSHHRDAKKIISPKNSLRFNSEGGLFEYLCVVAMESRGVFFCLRERWFDI